jgi:thioredoxin 1
VSSKGRPIKATDEVTIEKGVRELEPWSFQELVGRSEKLIIVEFYMRGCEVCQAMAPIYEQPSHELAEHAVFYLADAETHINLALRYGVTGTPTLKLFRKDKFLGEIVGETNATVLKNTIKDLIRHQLPCSARAPRMIFELNKYGRPGLGGRRSIPRPRVIYPSFINKKCNK